MPFTEASVVLSEDDRTAIKLGSLEDRALSESSQMAIWGNGFKSEQAAREAGERWRAAMQRALAGVNLGANFGLRNPNMGGLTQDAMEEIKRETMPLSTATPGMYWFSRLSRGPCSVPLLRPPRSSSRACSAGVNLRFRRDW